MAESKKPKKFGALQRRLLEMHPNDMRNSDLQLLRVHIKKDPKFATAWRSATPKRYKDLTISNKKIADRVNNRD